MCSFQEDSVRKMCLKNGKNVFCGILLQCKPNPAQRFFLSHKRMCLGTFSRRGAVALATIYPCAECASSRSIFIVWTRSFLYDKTKIPDRHESFSSTSIGNSIFSTTDLCSAHLLFFSSACLLQQAIVVSPSERYLPDVREHRFP